MKTMFTFLVFIFLFETAQSQEIDATLSGNTSSEGLSVKNLSGSTLFRVNGLGNVGIGTTSPLDKLHIADPNQVYIRFSNTSSGVYSVWANHSLTPWIGTITANDFAIVTNFQFRLRVTSSGDVAIGTLTPAAMLDVNGTMNVSGEVSMTAMDVSFYAYNSVADVSGSTSSLKVEFDGVRHNDGSNYDATLDRFVAPVSGVYYFSAGVEFLNLTNGTRVLLSFYKGGIQHVRFAGGYANTSNDYQIFSGSAVIKLNAGEYIEVFAFLGSGIPNFNGSTNGTVTYFSGHRLY